MKIEVACEDIKLLIQAVDRFREESIKHQPSDVKERLAELEIKMTKLWQLLTKESVTGETKVSKFGRRLFLSSQGLNTK